VNLNKIFFQELQRTAALVFILLALLALPYWSGQISVFQAVLLLIGSALALFALLCQARLHRGLDCGFGRWVYLGLGLSAGAVLLALAGLGKTFPFLYEWVPLIKGAGVAALLLWLARKLDHRKNLTA
jgi:hypothetical protein